MEDKNKLALYMQKDQEMKRISVIMRVNTCINVCVILVAHVHYL